MGNAILNTLVGIVLTQAFGGVIFLLAFVPMMRKFMNQEVPAMIADVHKDFDGLKAEFKELNVNVNVLSRALDRSSADFEARLRAVERAIERFTSSAQRDRSGG